MTLALDFAFAAKVTIGPVLELGTTQRGRRRIIPITGGTVEGPRLAGIVLPGGADWQTIRADGVAEIEARYTLQAADGALIGVVNRGLRRGSDAAMKQILAGQPADPNSYYFRTSPVFDAAAPAHQWLTNTIFVASGQRHPEGVEIRFYAVL